MGVSDSLQPHGLYRPWSSLGQNTGVGSLSLLQGIFPTQRSNPGLPHCRRILYQLSHNGSPKMEKRNKQTYFQRGNVDVQQAMAPHSSTLAWKIPWMEEPGGLQSHHGVAKSQTWLSDFTFIFHFYALEKEMATHSSVLAWRISGMGEPGGLPSMGSHRVGHDWSDLAAATGI